MDNELLILFIKYFKEFWKQILDKNWRNGFSFCLIFIFTLLSFNNTPISIYHNEKIADGYLNQSLGLLKIKGMDEEDIYMYTLEFDNYDFNCIYNTVIKTNAGSNANQKVTRKWCKNEVLNKIIYPEFDLNLKEIFLQDNKISYSKQDKFNIYPRYILLILIFIKLSVNVVKSIIKFKSKKDKVYYNPKIKLI